MRRRNGAGRRGLVFALLFLNCMFVATEFCLSATKVWVTDSLRKLQPYETAEDTATISIYAAKNEFESFQIVISSASTNINSITMTASALTSAGGTIPASNVKFFREHYMQISTATDSQSIGVYKGAPVFVPDALVPYDRQVPPTYQQYNPSAIALDLNSEYNKVFWLDIYVPPTAVAGYYTGIVTVDVAGQQFPIAVNLRVWDFALPTNNSFKISFQFNPYLARKGHKLADSDQSYLCQEYAKEAIENRISFYACSPQDPPYTYNDGGTPGDFHDDTMTINWTSFDQLTGPMLDGTITSYGRGFETYILSCPYNIVGVWALKGITTPLSAQNEMKLVLYWREFAKHFKEKGWFDKLYFYNVDEPNNADNYADTLYLSRLLFYADPSVPSMVTSSLNSELNKSVTIDPSDPKFNQESGFYDAWYNPGYTVIYDTSAPDSCKYHKPAIDIWDVPNLYFDFNYYTKQFTADPAAYRQQQAQGRHVWWYLACGSWLCMEEANKWGTDLDVASTAIDVKSVYLRHFFWLSKQYNTEGFLVWGTVSAYDNISTVDPWINQFSVEYGSGGNGDGTMFYPGRPDKIGGSTHKAIPSIRIKTIRDGVEDCEYFKMLDDWNEDSYLASNISTLVTNTQNWSHNASAYFAMRKQFGDKIEALGGNPPPPPSPPPPPPPSSSTSTVHNIGGYVRDSAGLGLGSVTVELSGSSSQTLSSDNNGRFSFGSCPNKGNFTVRAVSQDYQFVPSSYTITSLSSDVAACIFTATTTARGTNVHAGEARIVGSADGRGTINPDKGDAALIYFKGTGTGTYECRIFTLTGELVWQDTLNQVQEGVFKWIPKDVSSGGYVVLIKGPGINIKKKLAVLR